MGQGFPRTLRIIAIVLALGLSTVILLRSSGQLDAELPVWLLFAPILFLVTASALASRSRSSDISKDDNPQDRDDA